MLISRQRPSVQQEREDTSMAEITYPTDEAVSVTEETPITTRADAEVGTFTDHAGVAEGEEMLAGEIIEELIIEDFTIDGICGVY